MDKEKINDVYISHLVQSIEHNAPEIPDLSSIKRKDLRSFNNKNITYLLRTIAATIVLLVGILFIHNPGKDVNKKLLGTPEIKEISEIRTDFVLREDNIKIIWIQKKNFKLN